MAHSIQLPISFEFRTSKIQWEHSLATVIGWWGEQGGTGEPLKLIAQVTRAGSKSTIALPLSKLPENERKQCSKALGKRNSDDAVKQICARLELQYFFHSHKKFKSDSELRKHSLPADAWQLREDFLGLRADVDAVLALLNTWGRWSSVRDYVDMAELFSLQEAVRRALTSPAKIWFRSLYASPPVVNSRSSAFPYFVILTDACEAAIRTTTTMDLLRQLKFKTCTRPDCDKPFPITSKHERNYCTQYCAHLESVRRARKSTPRSV
jgi:hypothetical protein